MADDRTASSMSMIPYPTNREIVLRHSNAIVEWDRSSRQLVLRNASQNSDLDVQDACPFCHRPMRDSHREDGRNPLSGNGVQPGFINPDYFRMLHNSHPGSNESSTPPSPRRRLVQPVQSGRDSPARPPPDAEFVGSTPAPPSAAHGISPTAFSQDYFKNFFIEEALLGKGGRGVVLLVKHMLNKVFLGYFACKRVPIGDDQTWLEKVLVEVQALQKLSHQNLVSYKHVWLEDVKLSAFGPSVPCAFILQQYCNGGDLHNYILGPAEVTTTTQQLKDRIRRRSKGQPEVPRELNEPRKLSFDEIYSFFKDITSGLRYLHAHGFIHRDLKPQNCLLDDSESELRVLISDFGEVQSENAIRKSTGATGTISYCAPEVLHQLYPEGPFGNFSFKSDVFSLGMILYFLCFARLPYHHSDVLHEEKEDMNLLRVEIGQWSGFNDEKHMRPDLPEKLYSFLKRLLSIRPEERPTADETLKAIKTGAELDEHHGRRIRRTNSSSSSIEDIHPTPRIITVSSPTPPETRSPRSPTKSQNATVGISRPRASRLRNMSYTRERKSSSAAVDSFSESENDDGPDTPMTSSDLILRPRFPSPKRPPGSPGRHHDYDFDSYSPTARPLLRPPSPAGFKRISSPAFQLIARTSIFIAKVFSLFQPCHPLATNPWICYPLLCLAGLEFGVRSEKTRLLLLLVHMAIVGLTFWMGGLCMSDGGRVLTYGPMV